MGDPPPVLRRRTSSCSTRPRSSSTAPAGATSSSTTRRSSTSTTPGCLPMSSPRRTSTPGGRRSGTQRPDLLTFTARHARRTTRPTRSSTADFPDVWRHGDAELPLDYHFEPGRRADGVTVDIPVSALNQVEAEDFTWPVPGLRQELVVALDPVAAQGAAGQLRAGAQPRARRSSPRRRRARSRCSTPSSGTCGGRPVSWSRATPGTWTRCPATCGCRSGWSTTRGPCSVPARTWRVLRTTLRERAGSGDRSGGRIGRAHRAHRLGLRRAAAHVRHDPGRPRGARVPGAGGRGRQTGWCVAAAWPSASWRPRPSSRSDADRDPRSCSRGRFRHRQRGLVSSARQPRQAGARTRPAPYDRGAARRRVCGGRGRDRRPSRVIGLGPDRLRRGSSTAVRRDGRARTQQVVERCSGSSPARTR